VPHILKDVEILAGHLRVCLLHILEPDHLDSKLGLITSCLRDLR
jgi:hypothetical protein